MLKKYLFKFTKVCSVVVFVSLVICVLAQIIFRYGLKISVPWTEEVARIAAVWLTFIGVAAVEGDNTQIRTEYFISKLKAKHQRIWATVMGILSSVFLIYLFIGSISMYGKANNIILGSLSWLKTSILYVPAIITVPISIVFIIYQIKDFKKFT